MNDNQIAALFMSELLPAIQATTGLAAVKMAKNYQPGRHGANTAPYVYFVKLGDHRYGFPGRKETYTTGTGDFTHTEAQLYESTYQFSAWADPDPEDVTALTESDILNIVSGIIQSDALIEAFKAQGVGILRVTEVRNPYIVDDRDAFEAVPSFDVILTHERTNATTIPAVVAYDLNMSRV